MVWQGLGQALQNLSSVFNNVAAGDSAHIKSAVFSPNYLQAEDLLGYLPSRLHEDAKEKLAAIESPEALAHVATALHYGYASALYRHGVNMGFLRANEPMKFMTRPRYWNNNAKTLNLLDLVANLPNENHGFFAKAENKVALETASFFSGFIDEAVKEKFGSAIDANYNFIMHQRSPWRSLSRKNYVENSNRHLSCIGKLPEYEEGEIKRPTPFAIEEKDISLRRVQTNDALKKLAKLVRSLPDDVNASRQYLEMATQIIEQAAKIGVDATIHTKKGAIQPRNISP
ncbi:MAG: hypothetical protein ACOYK8_07820 [Alphaproteobacteria bacterium]